MTKKIIILITTVLALASSKTMAIPIQGVENIIDNGGGSFTYIFDQGPGGSSFSDVKDSEGIFFQDGSSPLLTVQSLFSGGTPLDSRKVIQDWPAHGGMGLDGIGTDNLDPGEYLYFNFAQSVLLTNVTLNGDHTDSASGGISIAGWLHDAADIDGVGDSGALIQNLTGSNFKFTSSDFGGYIESVTINTTSVSEPATLGLMTLGLMMLGVARRFSRR